MENKNQMQKSCGNPAKELSSRKRIDTLFLRMQSIFANRWTALFPTKELIEIAKNEWLQSLSNISNEVIIKVLDSLRLSKSYFPPNLPEFMEMCRIEKDNIRKKYLPKQEKINVYQSMTESTRQKFHDAIDKCANNKRQDLCDVLCRLLLTLEEKGTWH